MSEYAEAEALLVAWLDTEFGSARVATETPSNLADVLPCIVVSRFGGLEDEVYTFDNASLDFDCYAATRAAARTLAHQVRTALRRDLPGETLGPAFVHRVQTIAPPIWTPYDNTAVRRFTYSAQIRLHTKEAA